MMRLLTGLKPLRDLLGFLLVSTGGTLSAIGILLLVARVGLGQSDLATPVKWSALFVISGVAGIIMLGGGGLLVRRSRRD
jgi:LPXTG-motif cell wall-anchored protein